MLILTGDEGHGRRSGGRQEAEHLLQQVVAEGGVPAGAPARATADAAAVDNGRPHQGSAGLAEMRKAERRS
jgi:hypothetical protein